MNSEQADRELVARARAGDKHALAVLIDRHYPTLLSLCRRALGEPHGAADAAQEAVVAAMLGLNRLGDDDRFGAWLYGIGMNMARRRLRSYVPRTESLDALLDGGHGAEPASAGAGPAELAEVRDVADQVQRAIAGLPAGQRQAVTLFYLAGLTQAEIADQLDTAPSAIKSRLHKARRSLRRTLTPLRKEPLAMTCLPNDAVPMRIADLRRTSGADDSAIRHVVFLEEVEGERRLPIWIGGAEATALAVILEDIELPRPGPYHLAAGLLTATGGRLREVRITELSEHAFYAQAILADGTTVDARPSDALTLAAVTDAQITVEPTVFDVAAQTEAVFADELARATDAEDDASTIAQETRGRLAEAAAELAAKTRRAG